ncbi:MAG: hypothetical protein QJR09_11845 [Micrococcus sp.]|nr:hypothetical protein [Micrococcus sp.]
MSDSLFLDPFAHPPSREPADSTSMGGDRAGGSAPASLAADIPLPPERAVEAFLEYVHLWWPVTLRACGEDSHLGFEDGALLEEGLDGTQYRWAKVVGIEGASLALRWFGAAHGPAGGAGVDVAVTFAAEPQGETRVGVLGSGPASSLEDWQPALEGFARFTGGTVRTAGA